MLATRQPRKRRVRARENGEVQSPYQLVQYVAYGVAFQVVFSEILSTLNSFVTLPGLRQSC